MRLLLLVALLLPNALRAQPVPDEIDYSVANLNPLLYLAGGDAVIRINARSFEVKSASQAVEKVHFAVTVMEESARSAGEMSIGYDGRLRSLGSFRGALYDATGKRIRKMGKDDQMDMSAFSSVVDFSDNRVRSGFLYHDEYPYTVEYTWEIEHDGLISWPAFYPDDERASVAYAAYEVSAPDDVSFRYYAFKIDLEPDYDRTDRRGRTVRWSVQNRPSLAREDWAPTYTERMPSIQVAPDAFEVERARGDLTSWQTFGQWYHDLQVGRDRLAPETVARVEEAVESAESTTEKARRLYAMMQDHTRYISVQLGLGGWQSFPAEYVEERSYGDCKALTNYLISLLRAADVEAYPVLIRAGAGAASVLADFPANQFNHVITAVPLAATDTSPADTLWLEATSQTTPFGWLGTFTSDRVGLLVKDGASQIVHTPAMQPEQNGQHRTVDVTLQPNGSANLTLVDRYSGAQKDRMHGVLHERTSTEQIATVSRTYALPSYEVVSFDPAPLSARDLEAAMPVALRANRYARSVGSRLFVPLSPASQVDYGLEASDERLLPIHMGYPYLDTDTVRIALPPGYTIEALPSPIEEQTDFAHYSAQVEQVEGSLIYTRRLELMQSRIPADQYADVRAFFQTVARADGAQAVLKKE